MQCIFFVKAVSPCIFKSLQFLSCHNFFLCYYDPSPINLGNEINIMECSSVSLKLSLYLPWYANNYLILMCIIDYSLSITHFNIKFSK